MKSLILRSLLGGCLFVFVGASCGGGASDSAKIKEFKGFVTSMCACKDATCATDVGKKESDWRIANYKSLSREEKGSMKNARQEFTTCRDALKKTGGK